LQLSLFAEIDYNEARLKGFLLSLIGDILLKNFIKFLVDPYYEPVPLVHDGSDS